MSTSDNIQKILSGLKLSPRFRCRINWHQWSRWEVTQTGHMKQSNKNFEELRRECEFCGRSQLLLEQS